MVITVCAQCGSRMRPEETWCSLCLAPVEGAAPEREAGAAPEPEVDAGPEPADAPEPPPVFEAEELALPDHELAEEAGAVELPEDWEDGVVATGPRQRVERRAQAMASADRLIAQLAVSESATLRATRLGRLQGEVARRTGLAPSAASMLIGAVGGLSLFLGLVLALTVLGLLL